MKKSILAASVFLIYIISIFYISPIKNIESNIFTLLFEYKTNEKIENYFLKNKYIYKISDLEKLPFGDKRPPFTFFKLLSENFQSIETHGEIELIFFNNELYQINYYPNDENKFQHEIKINENIFEYYFFKIIKCTKINTRIEMCTLKESNKKIKYSFSDKNIQTKINDWIGMFS